MVRWRLPGGRATALAVALAVPVSASWAPFVHAHDDHATSHHAAHAVHAHLGGHDHAERGRSASHEATAPLDGPSAGDTETDRAVYLQALLAVGPTMVAVAVAPQPLFELSTPPELPAHRSVEVTHGHDPPLADSLDSRPPPARLS